MAPILSIEEAVNHPHLRERRTVRKIHDPFIGEYDIPGVPLRFSDFPTELELRAPLLGEHNAEILGGLGYSADRISDLGRRASWCTATADPDVDSTQFFGRRRRGAAVGGSKRRLRREYVNHVP